MNEKIKLTLKSILNRVWNKGSILALAGLFISLLIQFGIDVDSEKVMNITTTICTILVSLGILNNPVDNTKAYVPFVSDDLVEEPKTLPTDDLKA